MGFFSWLFRKPKTFTIADVPGPGDFGIEVVGESSYQEALSHICGGRTESGHDLTTDALLIPEDDNPVDEKAIRVDIAGRCVGYISREHARQLRRKMREEGVQKCALRVKVRIRGGWDRGADDVGLFGVTVDLPTNN